MKIKANTYAVIHNTSGEVQEATITRQQARQIKAEYEHYNPGEKFSIIQYTVAKKVR